MSPVKVDSERMHPPITVKIVTMGAGITQYVGDTTMTLGQLLEQLVVEQVDVRVNGAAVDRPYRLMDGDQVLLVPKIRAAEGRARIRR